MLCSVCNERDAELFVQQQTVTGKREVHLCSQCAKRRGLDIDHSRSNNSLEVMSRSGPSNQTCCYACGMQFYDIEKLGVTGCPECYVAFSREIKTMLENTGLDGPYTGEMPKTLAHFRSILTDRIKVQKKLEASIAQEDFEKAAMYRDFLKTLDRSSVSLGDEGELFDK